MVKSKRPRDARCGVVPRGSWRDLLWCLGVLAGVLGLAFLILIAFLFLITEDFPSEVVRSTVALAICMIGGLAGLVVICLGQKTNWSVFAPLLASGVRTLFTLLVLTAVLLMSEGLVTVRMLLYLILFYIVIIWTETFLSLRTCMRSSAPIKETEDATNASRSEVRFFDSEANSGG